jgi:hypothetical protein
MLTAYIIIKEAYELFDELSSSSTTKKHNNSKESRGTIASRETIKDELPA